MINDADLLVNDAHWAFGTGFEDPLAGVDTTVPEGVDAAGLARCCLMLGDDALVLSQRLSEWCSRAPDLEEDIALSNIALDLLGQARLLLARAAAADPSLVPVLPEDSPVPAEDALAFFRDAGQFRNVVLAELPNGDFAETVTRLLLFSTWRLEVFEQLVTHADTVLAAVAAKGRKELSYHRDFSARWFVTLARGTEESRRRVLTAVDALWPWWSALDVPAEVDVVLEQVFAAARVERPEVPPAEDGGREGGHTAALTDLLADMQSVARAHPRGLW
ncbi:1,2-phenylacetyl-CoA epoxidase subunit PaaC [Lentzea albida]|uniref:Ring-1,2-phenylacetyl-CoA epoxidase subunit PaaC n=1 Tax=Lentzea albida TaxID=65499 RepID=A0A1H9JZW6_9PSEU|nr:1,2-phenylacetyl-CoA epoxidase subunit PaaC [Lentzea albida]SEQ92370.1 ring-1,2-phenylacetyl-CoA epoxidase subunit PaaC [Lentzea albida]